MRPEQFKEAVGKLMLEQQMSEPSSVIVKYGVEMLRVLQNSPVFVPVVSNACMNPSGPYYISDEKTDLKTEWEGKTVYLASVPGKGLYARVEELIQLNAVTIEGTHTIVLNLRSSGIKYTRYHTCYVMKLKP